jgi:lysozyme family protein
MSALTFSASVARVHSHQQEQADEFFIASGRYGFAGDWDESLKDVLEHEGGNDDDPRDPGGRTSRGIIQSEWTAWRKTHSGLPADVWQAPQDQLEKIYHENYWNALHCDDLPLGVDYAVFDYGVNSGTARAQRVLAGIHVTDPTEIITAICDERLAFLRGLRTWPTFGRGWSRRVADVRRDAIAMAKAVPSHAPKPVPPLHAPELHGLGQRIKATMLARGYPWFPDQNVVSVEAMDPNGTPIQNRPNAFDDIKMVLDGDGKIVGGPWEGTTHPGKYWTEHPMASGGAFIIALGPQSCWTPGPYHGLTVWRQAEESTIMGHRDPDCTYQRRGAPIKHGDIGVHHHGGYNLPRDNIANAAAGCQVIRLTDCQAEFMRITMACPRYLKDPNNYRLTATVITAEDVVRYSDAPIDLSSTASHHDDASSTKPPASQLELQRNVTAWHFGIIAVLVAAWHFIATRIRSLAVS